MASFTPELTIIEAVIANISGKIVRDFGELENIQSSFKGTSGFTDVLLKTIKERLIEKLSQKEGFGIVYEDEIIVPKQNKNFLVTIENKLGLSHSLRDFSVAIAVEEKDEIISGIIDNPINKESFLVDKKNNLSLFNGKKAKVSQRKDDTIIGITTCDSTYKNSVISKSNLQNLCYVGMGKYDAIIIDNKTPLLDLGLLFAKIAGATTKEENGKIIVSNGVIKI
ncbi:MAG: hypothetical protein Ta2D_02620 [Rickettsiales bacterium]|nr:MAG: hypothetical protein Ta2D_02620 [Rickettsiales bacterium]